MIDPNQQIIDQVDNDWVDEFLSENAEDYDTETEYDDNTIDLAFDIDYRGDWGWFLTLTERGLRDTQRHNNSPLGVIGRTVISGVFGISCGGSILKQWVPVIYNGP